MRYCGAVRVVRNMIRNGLYGYEVKKGVEKSMRINNTGGMVTKQPLSPRPPSLTLSPAPNEASIQRSDVEGA